MQKNLEISFVWYNFKVGSGFFLGRQTVISSSKFVCSKNQPFFVSLFIFKKPVNLGECSDPESGCSSSPADCFCKVYSSTVYFWIAGCTLLAEWAIHCYAVSLLISFQFQLTTGSKIICLGELPFLGANGGVSVCAGFWWWERFGGGVGNGQQMRCAASVCCCS